MKIWQTFTDILTRIRRWNPGYLFRNFFNNEISCIANRVYFIREQGGLRLSFNEGGRYFFFVLSYRYPSLTHLGRETWVRIWFGPDLKFLLIEFGVLLMWPFKDKKPWDWDMTPLTELIYPYVDL